MRKDRRNGISMFLRNSARFLTKLRRAILWFGIIQLSCLSMTVALEPAPVVSFPEPFQGMPTLSGFQITWTKQTLDAANWPGFRGFNSFVGQATSGRTGIFLYAGPPGVVHNNIIYSAYGYNYSAVSSSFNVLYGGNPVPDTPGGAHVLSMTFTNPAVLTIDQNFPNTAGASLLMESATVTNCAGLNGNQTTLSTSGGNVTINFDASACSGYVSSSGYLLNQGCLGTSTAPPNQHPGQMAIDSLRHRAYLIGGLNTQTCGGGHDDEIWYLPLDQTTPTNWIDTGASAGTAGENVTVGRVYDPDDDVIFIFGNSYTYPNHWVYCETNANPTIRAKQIAAGCATGGAVNPLHATGIGGADCNASPTSCDEGVDYSTLVYDSVHKKVLTWGGSGTSTIYFTDTWAFDVPTQSWSKLCGAGCTNPTNPAPLSGATTGQPAMVFNAATGTGLVFLHFSYNVGGTPQDFAYDYAQDKWYVVASSGGGPDTGHTACLGGSPSTSCEMYMGLDSAAGTYGTLATWGNDQSSDNPEMWQGAVTALGSSSATVTSGIQSSGVIIR